MTHQVDPIAAEDVGLATDTGGRLRQPIVDLLGIHVAVGVEMDLFLGQVGGHHPQTLGQQAGIGRGRGQKK